MQDTTILQKGQVWQPNSLQKGWTDDQKGEKRHKGLLKPPLWLMATIHEDFSNKKSYLRQKDCTCTTNKSWCTDKAEVDCWRTQEVWRCSTEASLHEVASNQGKSRDAGTRIKSIRTYKGTSSTYEFNYSNRSRSKSCKSAAVARYLWGRSAEAEGRARCAAHQGQRPAFTRAVPPKRWATKWFSISDQLNATAGCSCKPICWQHEPLVERPAHQRDRSQTQHCQLRQWATKGLGRRSQLLDIWQRASCGRITRA